MPETSQERLERVFGEAAERAGAERERYLAGACNGDIALLAEVRALLEADARETIAALRVEPLKSMLESAPAAMEEPAPETIGVYRVESVIGEGGFGTVYRARQTDPVERVVAIKMVRAGMATRDSLRRFERERRTLAQLEHPNIARLLDAGTSATGRPYFVMELVRGVPITEFCDSKRLGTSARLALFARVCEAIQHAHQRGVIHRDIKPSNILVADEDARTDLKVIDFGIASVLEDERGRREALTGHGGGTRATAAGQFIGTPEYMSPEQADVSLGVVDTRSDIYSLGVLLYQLLTGELPYTRTEVIAATLRAGPAAPALQVREARRPSTVLGCTAAGLTRAAEARGTDVRTLVRQIRGDLDWIALKALARRPQDRYASVSQLAEDIRRSLADEPILAHAPSWREQTRKFVKRHKFGVAAGVALALALVAGVIGTGVGLVHARESASKERVASSLAESRRVAAEASAALAEKRRHDAEYEAYTGRIAAAAGALEASGPIDLKKWLDEAPAPLRGWEWKYLRGLADQSVGDPFRVRGVVQMLAVSPVPVNGRVLVACACRDENVAIVLDAGTGAEVRRFAMPQPECVRFSPDGKLLACGSRDAVQTVRIYRTSSWHEQCSLRGLSTAWDVEFAPNSDAIAVIAGPAGSTCTVRLHDVHTGAEILDTHMEGYFSLSWSSDSRFIASGDLHGTIHVWDCDRFRVVMDKRISKNIVQGVAFSPDSALLAIGTSDGILQLLRVPRDVPENHTATQLSPADPPTTEWKVECDLDQRRSPVFRLVFSPDSSKLASATWGNTAWVWDVATRTVERELRGHNQLVHAIGFTPDGQSLFTGSYDGSLRHWRIDGCPQSRRVAEEAYDGTFALSPDGKWCATLTLPTRLSIFDLSDGTESAWIDAARDVPAGFRFMADSKRLLIGTRAGDVISINPWTAERSIITSVGGGMEVRTLSPSGRLAAGYVSGKGCIVIDIQTGEKVWGWPTSLAWAAVRFIDERTLLTHKPEGGFETWDIVDSKRLSSSEERAGTLYDAALSPDGTKVGAVGFHGEIALLDARTGMLLAEPASIGRFAAAPQFTADGTRLVTGGEDGLIRFWEIPSMRQMAAIRADRSWTASAITPDDRLMVVKSQGNLMRFWRADQLPTEAPNASK